MTEYFENKTIVKKGEEMKVAPVAVLHMNQFQNYLMSAKTMRSKLAICFKKLSEQGAFSDASEELHEFRAEILGHLPEELKSG
jgi:hypothetical protein